MEWQEWVIIQKSRWMRIWNELLQFKYVVFGVPLVDLWLRDRGFHTSLVTFALIVIIIFILVWIAGILWDRAHLIDYENNFQNKRNPLEMKKIKILEQILEEMKKFK